MRPTRLAFSRLPAALRALAGRVVHLTASWPRRPLSDADRAWLQTW